MLPSICKAELQEVSGHESEQHQHRDGELQLAANQSRGQLLFPSSLKTHENVQQSAQQHILLDNVGLKSEACAIQQHVVVIVPVEIVRSPEHMKISDRVHHAEKGQSTALLVCGSLEVLRRKKLGTDLVDDAEDQVIASINVRTNFPPYTSKFATASPLSVATGADFAAPFTLLAFTVPTIPMTASGAYLPTTSGRWIMSKSAVASFPANVSMANSPPGCCDKKFETFSTRPFRITHASPYLLCFATSSMVYPPSNESPFSSSSSPPSPSVPMIASGAYFSITSGG